MKRRNEKKERKEYSINSFSAMDFRRQIGENEPFAQKKNIKWLYAVSSTSH